MTKAQYLTFQAKVFQTETYDGKKNTCQSD